MSNEPYGSTSNDPYGSPGQPADRPPNLRKGSPSAEDAPRGLGDPPATGTSWGQPQYGEPNYGQPQFGQPQYGQPQFGPPPPFGSPPPFAPAYSPYPVPSNSNGLAVASLVTGILGFICCIPGLVGIGLGIAGLNEAKRTGVGRGMSIAGICCGAGWAVLGLGWLLVQILIH